MVSISPTKPLTMLDTNVLVDALYEDLPEYPAASHLLDLADDAGAALCVAPQVLAVGALHAAPTVRRQRHPPAANLRQFFLAGMG